MANYEREREVAVEAVTEAALLCRAVQDGMATPDTLKKGDRSPVTVADFGAQALVCRRLREAFPADQVVAEEDSSALRVPANLEILTTVTSYVARFVRYARADQVADWIDVGNGAVGERFWTLDPIDGTKGFLRRMQYAVALALVEDGAVRLGVLGCPALSIELAGGPVGTVFVASRGRGASMASLGSTEWVGISVARGPEPGARRFVESVESSHGDAELQESVARAVGFDGPPLRIDSQVKYGAIARGDASLYLRVPSRGRAAYREKIWDHAAGALIVEEAGGRVTDMAGRSLDFASSAELREGAGIVASSGPFHDAVLSALSGVVPR